MARLGLKPNNFLNGFSTLVVVMLFVLMHRPQDLMQLSPCHESSPKFTYDKRYQRYAIRHYPGHEFIKLTLHIIDCQKQCALLLISIIVTRCIVKSRRRGANANGNGVGMCSVYRYIIQPNGCGWSTHWCNPAARPESPISRSGAALREGSHQPLISSITTHPQRASSSLGLLDAKVWSV